MIDTIYIIIPTLNEEKNIYKIYNYIIKLELTKKLKVNFKIIFTDDNSTDNTRKIIQKLIKKNKNITLYTPNKRLGLGNALGLAIKNLKKGFAIFIDCDVLFSKKTIFNLIKNRKKNTMIVGSRYLRESTGNSSKLKILLGKILNFFLSILFKLKINDLTHSLRIFDLDKKLKFVNKRHPGFFLEISVNYAKTGNLEQLPIEYQDRIFGYSKIKLFPVVVSLIHSFFILLIKN